MADYPYDETPSPRRELSEEGATESRVSSELHAGPEPRRPHGLRGKIKAKASGLAESQKARVADRVDRLGERIEERARPLEAKGGVQGRVGRTVHRAGDALEGSADYLRTHDIPTMRDDLAGQIRSHPLTSVGMAFGAGLLLSRAMVGGESEDEREQEDRHERAPESEGRRREGRLGRAAKPLLNAALGGATAMIGKEVRDRVAGRRSSR